MVEKITGQPVTPRPDVRKTSPRRKLPEPPVSRRSSGAKAVPPSGMPPPFAQPVGARTSSSETPAFPQVKNAVVSYRDLTFLEKTAAITMVLGKLRGRYPDTDEETRRGVEIVSEHLFLVMELERIGN